VEEVLMSVCFHVYRSHAIIMSATFSSLIIAS
jgi:hypothetical protein